MQAHGVSFGSTRLAVEQTVMLTLTKPLQLSIGLDSALAAPPRKGAGGPVDQKAVMTTPTTSA